MIMAGEFKSTQEHHVPKFRYGMMFLNRNNVNDGEAPLPIPTALAQARCYSNALWQLPEQAPNLCIKNLRFNWDANTLEKFMNLSNGPVTPRSRYVFEKFIYTSLKSGSFTQVDRREDGFSFNVTSGSNSWSKWVKCQMIQTMEFNMTFIDSITMIGDMKQTTKLLPETDGSDPLLLNHH